MHEPPGKGKLLFRQAGDDKSKERKGSCLTCFILNKGLQQG